MPAPPNSYRPLAEDLLCLPGAELKRMFGAEAIYVEGLMLLVLADKEPPWNGLLFPAERENHAAILDEFGYLVPHAVLPKWLYLSADQDHFEARAQPLLACLLNRDERFGVIPKPKKRKKPASGTDSKAAKKRRRQAKGANPPPSGAPVDDGRPPHLR